METFLNGLTLSEISFKVLFIFLFWYTTKRAERREEILLKKLEDMTCESRKEE